EAKATEEARIAAEKKKAQEEARLAEAERAKSIAKTKGAEEARIAAEKARKIEEEKANQARLAAEKKKAEEEVKTAEAERAKAAAEAKAAADKSKAVEANKSGDEKPIGALAARTPAEQSAQTKPALPSVEELPRLLQTELRRVGCNTGAIDGNWNAAARRSLDLFNKSAGTTFDIKVASLDTLDFVRSKTARICPLICERGYKADGDTCTRITCEPGFEIGDDNSCVK